ncbi:MAG: GNAT family N-acetyltransferase [Hyphomicrobiaceae bacterium]|nr:GNAT family N-acetyltransferase [Hyphomicrobiaceae bacterium]
MGGRDNEFGQPIGCPVAGWSPRLLPSRVTLAGRLCRIEPIDPARHTTELYDANRADDGRGWTYMGYGPFESLEAYRAWAERVAASSDPLFYTILDPASGRATGVASLMRIDPANGVIEVGHIKYAPALQRTPAATEAMFLLMRYIFDELGYRRYEWKCDSLNAPSRAAAARLGFVYEGIFRQAVVYKGRNRDTAWFAMMDHEWPALRRAYEQWLEPANFDDAGRQRRRLFDLIGEARASASGG